MEVYACNTNPPTDKWTLFRLFLRAKLDEPTVLDPGTWKDMDIDHPVQMDSKSGVFILKVLFVEIIFENTNNGILNIHK